MKMTAKEVLENLISTIEKNSTDNKATITNVDLWVKSWREELSKVNNSVLDDVSKQSELLKPFEFRCSKCNTIHKKNAYAIAQNAMNVGLVFTCTCGNKIDL